MNHRKLWLCLPFLASALVMPSVIHAETQREKDARTGNDIDHTTAHDTTPKTKPADTEIPVVKKDDFGGSWAWAEGDERFHLTLRQDGDKITGNHMAEREGGGKIDATSGGSLPSISGVAHGRSCVVRWRSGAPGSEAYGHARLTLRGKYLYWELMDDTGEHYLPHNAVLIRQTH